MEGHNARETVEKLGCGVQTDERRLSLIGKIWEVRS